VPCNAALDPEQTRYVRMHQRRLRTLFECRRLRGSHPTKQHEEKKRMRKKRKISEDKEEEDEEEEKEEGEKEATHEKETEEKGIRRHTALSAMVECLDSYLPKGLLRRSNRIGRDPGHYDFCWDLEPWLRLLRQRCEYHGVAIDATRWRDWAWRGMQQQQQQQNVAEASPTPAASATQALAPSNEP
jgi:hypothetical protein